MTELETQFNLPLLEWCFVPSGETYFQGKTYVVNAFKMSKYTVTFTQYQTFAKAADGYKDTKWWDYSKVALGWRQERPLPYFSLAPAGTTCLGISWYAAIAFCRWLSEKTNLYITLPTEMQYQRGVMETKGGQYYEHGFISGYGVHDINGYVWEWCLNEYANVEETTVAGDKKRAIHSRHHPAGENRMDMRPSESSIIAVRLVALE